MSNSAEAILGYGLVVGIIENNNGQVAIENKYLAATGSTLEASPFILQNHGNIHCDTELLVFIEDSIFTTSEYNDSISIDPQRIIINPSWDQLLLEFCTAVEIDYKNPSWRLCVFYG